MLKVKLSSKRQATFPRKVCESLGLEAGDELMLEPSGEGDVTSWTLRPVKARPRPWLHRFKSYAREKDHAMESIRASIANGRES